MTMLGHVTLNRYPYYYSAKLQENPEKMGVRPHAHPFFRLSLAVNAHQEYNLAL
jgi:hypothetical protein